MIDLVYSITEDGLRLPGVHYFPIQKTSTCVVVVHGMSGDILENYNFDVFGKICADRGLACIYGHNRGHGHINDTRKINTQKSDNGYEYFRGGARFERFNDCVFDIDSWFEWAKKFGYTKFILLGHSLGGPKVVHYMYKKTPNDVIGVVLASPGDMVGLVKKPEYQNNYQELVDEANRLVDSGKSEVTLSGKIWDWYEISAQTFLDLFVDEGPADNLPMLRNPDRFEELEAIKVPILDIVGEFDDIAIRTLEEDQDLLEKKATNCKDFTKEMVPGANHSYDRREKEFSEVVIKWIKGL